MSDIVRGPYRNDSIVIIQNLTITGSILAFCLLSLIGSLGPQGVECLILAAVLIAAGAIIMFWRTTTIEFGEQDLTVRHNFISKKVSVIPYTRVAAVNVTRTVFDRLAGTATLQFNVNSAVNAARPEAAFCFPVPLADELRDFVYARTFRSVSGVDRDTEHESLVSFTPLQVIAHVFLSQPTVQLGVAAFFLLFTVAATLFQSGGGVVVGLVMLAVQEVIPLVSQMLRYYGFRMYRDGSTICLQHGAIHMYRTEFDVAKVNAVRIRRPFLARLLGRSCLEAEVVGINAKDGDVTPTLCLLMPEDDAEQLLREILPEFVRDIPETARPPAAKRAMFCQAAVFDAVCAAVMAWPCWTALHWAARPDVSALGMEILRFAPLTATALVLIYAFWRSWRSYRLRSIGLGADLLVMRNGLLDRERVVIQYDRIQLTVLKNDLIARHFGVCRCSVCLLSTAGSKQITSGYFPRELLAQIPAIVQARIDDGRYDPHENMV